MISIKILRLLFAICTAPIKQLVYLPIFEIFVIFPISCEMTDKGYAIFGGRWEERIRFILGDVQIDKLNFQNIYFLYLGGSPY